ncbi:MAG TPA: 50S ribosomal protein L22 [Firmicutes bacterium]|nr:50S ribosomal protein L22 [Candidatus Fermentithermobacillaceae bacterium]
MGAEARTAEARAVVRHVRISPTKARIVANLVKGKPVREALAILRYTPKRASRVIEKAIVSARANAENNLGLSSDALYVSRIFVDEGPTLKRYHPRQKGQAFPILKRTCHISVVLQEREEG